MKTSAEKCTGKWPRNAAEKCGCVNVCVPAAGITRDGLAVKIDKQIRQVSIYPIESFRLCCGIIHPRLHRYSNGAGHWGKVHFRANHSADSITASDPTGRNCRCDLLYDFKCRSERLALG